MGRDCETTRWDGHKCIDFAFTSAPKNFWFSDFLEAKISDHMGIGYCSSFEGLLVTKRGRLKPTPIWRKLDSVSTEVWDEALEKAWNSVVLNQPCLLTGVIAWTPNRKEPRRTGFKNNGTYSWLHSRKPFLKPSVPLSLMLPLVKIFKTSSRPRGNPTKVVPGCSMG